MVYKPNNYRPKDNDKNKRSEQLVCKCGLNKIGIRMCNRTDCDNKMYFTQTNCI